MELTILQLLQQGVSAHRKGKLKDAERLYQTILKSQPTHPDANHNLGLIVVSDNKAGAALPLFKAAVEANPKIEQFWLSYINALIEEEQYDHSKQMVVQAKKQGVSEDKLNILEIKLSSKAPVNEPTLALKSKGLSMSERRKKSAEQKRQKKAKKLNIKPISPSETQVNGLIGLYQNGQLSDAEKMALSFTKRFPEHQFGWKVLGAILSQSGRLSESLSASQRSVQIEPRDPEVHFNQGNTVKRLGRLQEAEANYTQAIALRPNFAEAHNNLGITLYQVSRLSEAEACYRQAIAFKPDYAEAHNNLGKVLMRIGRHSEALSEQMIGGGFICFNSINGVSVL